MTIKLQTKLAFLLFILILIFLLGISWLRILEVNSLNLFFKDREQERGIVFDKILELKGSSLQNLAYDYSFWDEMVRFVSTADKTWAYNNIETGIGTFKANAAWVYRTDYSLVYSYNDLKDKNLKELPLPKKQFKRLFEKEYFQHFFILTKKGWMEIRTAPIQPSADIERITPPQGYWIVGRLWDKKFNEELAKLVESVISIYPAEKKANYASDFNRGIIIVSKILNNWDGWPLAYIYARSESPLSREYNRAANFRLGLIIIFALVILILPSFFLVNWVMAPLGLIARSLDAKNPSILKKLREEKSEFGNLAELINKFFEQNAQLVSEVAERQRCETEAQEWKRRYELTVASSGQVVYDWDILTSAILWGGSVEQVLGYKMSEMCGGIKQWEEGINPEDRERALKMLESAQRDLLPYDVEYRFKHKKGDYLWIRDRGFFITGTAGRAIRMLGMMQDITENKRVEKELKEHIKELEEFQDVTVGRELKMIELEKKIKAQEEEIERLKKGGK